MYSDDQDSGSTKIAAARNFPNTTGYSSKHKISKDRERPYIPENTESNSHSNLSSLTITKDSKPGLGEEKLQTILSSNSDDMAFCLQIPP